MDAIDQPTVGSDTDERPSGGGSPLVHLTEKAVEMLKVAQQREGVPGHGLRVGVAGGGCSGLQYQLSFAEKPGEGDAVVEVGGVRVFIDAASSAHVRGMTLDYVSGLHGAGFKFLNPNAVRTCGCGTSFAT
jgi:iron-sulfur cluster assembly accessory protein